MKTTIVITQKLTAAQRRAINRGAHKYCPRETCTNPLYHESQDAIAEVEKD